MIGAAFLLLAASQNAAATPSPSDIRCLAIFSVISKNAKTEEQRRFVASVVSYNLGRIDGRSPGTDLSSALINEVKQLTPQNINAAGKLCQQRFFARANDLKLAGEKMQELGRKRLQEQQQKQQQQKQQQQNK